jgi:cytochrome c1
MRQPRIANPLTAATLLTLLAAGGCMTTSGAAQGAPPPSATSASGAPFVQAPNDSVAGQYLVIVGGCHDCHTVGWAESNGRTPPAEQLAGSNVGYRGPWGTSYAANLRNVAQRASEDRWVQILTTADGGHGRPPMPWMNTAAMNERDLRAMYRYVHSLGARGANAPRAVSPDSTPRTPYINSVPVQPTGVR